MLFNPERSEDEGIILDGFRGEPYFFQTREGVQVEVFGEERVIVPNVPAKDGSMINRESRNEDEEGPQEEPAVRSQNYLADSFRHAEHGQEHGYHDGSDDQPHENDDEGLDHAGEPFDGGVHFGFIKISDL